MRIRTKREKIISSVINKCWKHLPSFIRTKQNHNFFRLHSYIAGKQNKNYLLFGSKIEFIHIPKTGGLSIKTALHNIDALEQSDGVHRPMSSQYDPKKINYVTCLREPVSRVFSLYKMGLRMGLAYPMYREAMSGLKSFIKSSTMKFECSNLQSRYCTLSPYKEKTNPEEAIKVLSDFKGVFIFEQIREDFDYLNLNLPHKNKHIYSKNIKSKDRELILSLNKTDQIIYDYFSKLNSEQRLRKLKSIISNTND